VAGEDYNEELLECY